MQRKRTFPPSGLVVDAGAASLTIHADGAAELTTAAGTAELSPEEVWTLAQALRAPGVAGLLSRAAQHRARSAYQRLYGDGEPERA